MELIFQYTLIFSTKPFIIFILLLFGLMYSFRVSLNLGMTIISGMFINASLKNYWQIPLAFSSHTYAFPSGHMFLVGVYTVGIALFCHKNIAFLFLMLFMASASASGIYYFGFHDVHELIAGFCFGGLLSLAYWICEKKIRILSWVYSAVLLIIESLIFFDLGTLQMFNWLRTPLFLSMMIYITLCALYFIPRIASKKKKFRLNTILR